MLKERCRAVAKSFPMIYTFSLSEGYRVQNSGARGHMRSLLNAPERDRRLGEAGRKVLKKLHLSARNLTALVSACIPDFASEH